MSKIFGQNVERRQRVLRVTQAALLATVIIYALYLVFELGSPRLNDFFDNWVYCLLIVTAAAVATARPILVKSERPAWTLMALALISTAAAEVYWIAFIGDAPDAPYPSIADVAWLAAYPLWCAGLALLVASRTRSLRGVLLLDGLIAALAIGAVGAGFILPEVIASGDGFAATATNVAYPVGDMLMLAFVFGTLALTGWRREASLPLVAAALIALGVGDVVYEYQLATGGYVQGTLVDLTWPLSAVLLAMAAWRQPPEDARETPINTRRAILAPAAFCLVALGVLVYGYIGDVSGVAITLAALSVVAVAVRMAFVYREIERLMDEARTDPLTGLGNRGKLLPDLRERIASASLTAPLVVVMLDLDGFKLYNDSFGHAAGDAMLRRLAKRLKAVVEGSGSAYRIGGDEFCLVIHEPPGRACELIAHALAALSEEGSGFAVTASYGTAWAPEEVDQPQRALELADERMYLSKSASRVSARSQAQEVLMRVLREREPDLGRHVSEVADLAAAVARRFTDDSEELDLIRRAAELHDIGKMAIPDAILDKPEPLNEEELNFVRDHTVIGDRILSSAPALAPVAKIVRSCHERWDGTGYPDGLEGREIPLGSRIIFACDALNAMTKNRPYSAAMPIRQALEELRACADTQFDPKVVDAVGEEIDGRYDRLRALADRFSSPGAAFESR